MYMDHRTYQGDSDQPMMLALARAQAAHHLHVFDLPYRLSSWGLDDPENVHLWFGSDGSLLGWAALLKPWWTVDIVCHPDHVPVLYAEMIAWADGRARLLANTPAGLPIWYVSAFTDQAEIVRTLEAAGFVNQADLGDDSWSKVFMRRPGSLPVKDYRIPPGFTVRSLAGEAEVEAYVDLHQAVFGTKNMTVPWRLRTLKHPGYRPDLDVVVAAPDGRLAAFCVTWLHGDQGQVEPLGCHADYRRYALGRVALAEGLRRLQAAGTEQIFVETDNYRDTAMKLYEHMGFEIIRPVWMFGKKYTQ